MPHDPVELGALAQATQTQPCADTASLLADLLMTIRPDQEATLAALSWRTLADRGEGPVHLHGEVTRLGATAARQILIGQELTLADSQARPLVRGSATWHGRTLSALTSEALQRADLGDPAWAAAMLERLNADGDFRDATHSFDGAIEIVSGHRQQQFRIYRGTVLEAGRKTPNGATFSVTGGELAWAGLMTSPRNDFISRASSGEFSSTGSSFQYLRMIKAVVLLAGHARSQWREERDALRDLS